MIQKAYPSWGKDEGKNIGGGTIPPLNKVRHYEPLGMIEYDIISARLYSIINEGRQAVMRVSGSPVVAEGGESLFAVYDPYGATSSLACGLLLHMVGTEGFVRETLEDQCESPGIYDGDTFMWNEPSVGGVHACDQWTGTPIFHEGELVAWVGALTHTAETGAIEPGGMPPSSRSLLHEGYRVQGIKIQDRGMLNKASLNCVIRSTRDPAYYTLDLRARIAGLNVAKRRIRDLIKRYGIMKIRAVLQQNIDYSEKLARAKLRSLADGTWRAQNFGDWDVGPTPKLWKINLTATKQGDSLTLDFTGSSEANKGPTNCMIHGTIGSCFVAIASQLFWEIPGNAGIMRVIKVIAPEGTIVNVPFLAPCCLAPARPGNEISNVVTTIIAKMLYTNRKYWEDVNACWCGPRWHGAYWGGMTQHGYPSAGMFGDVWASGTGAGIDEGRGDGCDSGANQMTVESCIADVETTELMHPFMYLWRREEKDTAGPGRWRGGASLSCAMVPHNTPYATIAFQGSGRYMCKGQSLDGAYPSSLGSSGPAAIFHINNLTQKLSAGTKPDSIEDIRKVLQKKGGEVKWVEPTQSSQPVDVNDVILSVNGGGGGVGDPLDREPEKVLDDVQRGIFSTEMANKAFGVIFNSRGTAVDKKATESARQKIRAMRKERGKVWKANR